jgi:hypothetical protein
LFSRNFKLGHRFVTVKVINNRLISFLSWAVKDDAVIYNWNRLLFRI